VPAILLAPQLAITFVFFVWPAIQSLRKCTLPPGTRSGSPKSRRVDNFIKLFAEPD